VVWVWWEVEGQESAASTMALILSRTDATYPRDVQRDCIAEQ
jgi:hypothetical protein